MPAFRIFRLVAFGVIAILLAFALHHVIGTGLRRVQTREMGSLNRIMSGKVNRQILISGSSRAFVHYDPRVIHEITGESTYNISRNGSHTDVQLGVLKAYLKHNTKPRLVVHNLDMHTFVPTPAEEIFSPAEYVPYLSEEELYRVLVQINPRVWRWKHIPLYAYVVDDMNFNWFIGLRGLARLDLPEELVDGFYGSPQAWTSDFDRFKAKHPDGVEFGIPPEGVKVLEELIETCQSNDIAVVLVYSPQYFEMLNLVRNRAEIFAKFREIAQRYGVPFWDFSSDDICRDKQFFYNSQHMNRKGAELFSVLLAHKLQAYCETNSPKMVALKSNPGDRSFTNHN